MFKFLVKKSIGAEIIKSVKPKTFEELKAEVIAILKKQAAEEEKTEKPVHNTVEKGGLPDGTKKEWPNGSGKWYIKMAGEWKRYYPGNSRGAKMSATRLIHKMEKEADTPEKLLAMIKANKERFMDQDGKPTEQIKRIMDGLHALHVSMKGKKESIPEAKDNQWDSLPKEAKDKKLSDYTMEVINATNNFTSKDYENLKKQVMDGKSGLIGGGDDIPVKERAEILSDLADSMKKDEAKDSGFTEVSEEEQNKMDRKQYHEYVQREQKDIPVDKIGFGAGMIKNLDKAYEICQKIAAKYGTSEEGIQKLEDFMAYNIDNASKLHDDLQKKLGMSAEQLDADFELGYKNALKKLMGTKTKADEKKEDQSVEDYHDKLRAGLEQEESEFQKHQNRSNAMKGNKNAYKGLLAEEKAKFVSKMTDDVWHDYDTDPLALSQHAKDGKFSGISMNKEVADIISSEPISLDMEDNIVKKIRDKYPKISRSYITDVLYTLQMGIGKNHTPPKVFVHDGTGTKSDNSEGVQQVKDNKKDLLEREEIKTKWSDDHKTLTFSRGRMQLGNINRNADGSINFVSSSNFFDDYKTSKKQLSQIFEDEEKSGNETPKADISTIRKAYENSKSVTGNKKTLYVGNEKVKGHWKLVEADAPKASHDENTYQKTPGFPTSKDGGTINDRDYEHDKDAQESVRSIAANFNGRALDMGEPVVVTKDGIVVSGNNRTMSSKLAAKNGTDKQYLADLKEQIEDFGFDEEDLDGFKHPRIVFEMDNEHEGDYTTEEFAKFNKTGKKSKNATEKAVEISKTIKPETIKGIANTITQFDTMGELWANNEASQKIINTMVKDNLIGQNDVSQYYTEDGGISGAGKEFVETVLIGSIMNENNIRSLSGEGGKSLRQKLVRAITPLIENKGDGTEYSFNNELNEAVRIAAIVNKDHTTYPDIQTYLKQGDMFEEKPSAITQKLAEIIHDNTQKEFADKMRNLEAGIRPNANGEIDIFLGKCETRNEVMNRFLSIKESVTKALNSLFGFFK